MTSITVVAAWVCYLCNNFELLIIKNISVNSSSHQVNCKRLGWLTTTKIFQHVCWDIDPDLIMFIIKKWLLVTVFQHVIYPVASTYACTFVTCSFRMKFYFLFPVKKFLNIELCKWTMQFLICDKLLMLKKVYSLYYYSWKGRW